MKSLLFFLVNASVLSGAMATQKVVIEADDDYAPYSYVEEGELKGIYVDVLRIASKKLAPNYEIELQAIPWKRGLKNLETGRSLALLPPYRSKERPYIDHYSVALYRETVALFCNPSDSNRLPRRFPDDFSGLNIGINLGFALGDKMTDAVKGRTFTVAESKGNEDNLWKLQAGLIDCYANDRLAVQYSFGKLQDKPKFKQFRGYRLIEAAELSSEEAFIGYSAASTLGYKTDFIKQMDAALLEIKRSGTINKLVNDYVRATTP
ncbi:substrate-binding periplasmic protein [Rhodoferax sp.]|uniref:substrate-binding periplasmic protein n=1 Tax=Rhodoferax sp. TaxID=50421 RepID=UPI00276F9C41|nr:transporter substrate-binding domain-containing protein [Rhodoferax sp.]